MHQTWVKDELNPVKVIENQLVKMYRDYDIFKSGDGWIETAAKAIWDEVSMKDVFVVHGSIRNQVNMINALIASRKNEINS